MYNQRSLVVWAVCLVSVTTLHVEAMRPAPLIVGDLRATMQAQNSAATTVKEIYVIPMTEVTVTQAEIGKEITKVIESQKGKKPLEKAVAASKKAEEMVQSQRPWRVILAQPVASRKQRIWQRLPFTKKSQSKWQILYQSLGKKVIADEKELEVYAYKMLAKLTYNGLSTSFTQFDKYVSEYLGTSDIAQPRPALPRIITTDNKAYFFIPVVAGITPAKLNSNAKRAWFGAWSKYGLGSIGADGALTMEGLMPNMTTQINDDDKHFIQTHWKDVVGYVNVKLQELVPQWEVRKARVQSEPEENRWDDFAGYVTISSDVTDPNSMLDLSSPQPFSADGKTYASASEYYVLKAQECSKVDPSIKKNCLIKAMFDANYYKFKNSGASRAALRRTGSAILLYNTEDPIFGVGLDKRGQNQVGRMQMFFRDQILVIENDSKSLAELWNIYTPSVQEWGKSYSQEALRDKLRYAINRFHIWDRIFRLFGWRR